LFSSFNGGRDASVRDIFTHKFFETKQKRMNRKIIDMNCCPTPGCKALVEIYPGGFEWIKTVVHNTPNFNPVFDVVEILAPRKTYLEVARASIQKKG
jgi:hypothetical protein